MSTTKNAKRASRRLQRFVGRSKFQCNDFSIRCLNMGSDAGRECNAPFDCSRKRTRVKANSKLTLDAPSASVRSEERP